MKILLPVLAVTLFGLPGNAQQTQKTIERPADRYTGKDCSVKIDAEILECDHLVITYGEGEDNFHFDTADESAGVLFILPKGTGNKQDYPVNGFGLRSGENVKVFAGSGKCTMNSPYVNCKFIAKNGTKVEAVIELANPKLIEQ